MLLNYNAFSNVPNFKGDQIVLFNSIKPFIFFILMGSQKQNATFPIICYPKKKKKIRNDCLKN